MKGRKMKASVGILTMLLWLSNPAAGVESEAFGAGEVDRTVLEIGDRVEITYRGRTQGGRLAEIAGIVVRVDDSSFVVETDDGSETLTYENIIRLDRTREGLWVLDPADIRLSEGEFIAKYLGNNELTGLEGMWVWDDGSFEVVVIKDETEGIKRFDYVGLVLASTQPGWRMGEVKLWIKETATKGVYAAVVITGEKEPFNTILEIEEERIIEAMLPGQPNAQLLERHKILRTYPIPEEPVVEKDSVEARQGSGFFVTADIVATASHLVDATDSVVVRFAGRSLSATVKSRDRRNGLALLVVDLSDRDALPGSTIVPLLLGDADQVLEGDRVVLSGFTSPDATRPSVSEGIVNSLFGPGEDLTRFSISITIRAGEVGGPLIDSSNRVIGIVLPADSTATGPVSVAVKSDLLSSLLKLTSVRVATIDSTSPSRDELDTSLIGQMARSAVVSIEAK